MDPMESIKQTYFQECEELLFAMEEGLLAMESEEADDEVINAVFRAVHSIKGGGGAFGFERLVTFSHIFETVLDKVRSGVLQPDQEVVKCLLRAGDVLADHVGAAQRGEPLSEDHDREIMQELETFSGEQDAGKPAEEESDEMGFSPMRIDLDDEDVGGGGATAEEGWVIRFAPQASLYAKGNEPCLIIRELASLGEIQVEADLGHLPPLAELDPDQAFIAWNIVLTGNMSLADVEEAFEFAADDCELEIRPLSSAPAFMEIEEAEPESEPSEEHTKEPEVLAAQPEKPEAAPAAEAAAERKESGSATKEAAKQTIRVDLDKVDRLVNLAGELVITQAMLAQRVHEAGLTGASQLGSGLVEFEHLLRDLQESVMAIRTQPVKSVFQRMPRLVRELAVQTGKEVRLLLEGESTEVDKTVIERLGEPLTHMIRNAIDHGLESTERRIESGKPAEGTVKLSAEHRGGRIVIEISDDGAGIDRARVREKAVEKGLIAETAVLSDDEIDNLIFMPGFSTASSVSNISGRGVGMDVVRRNIVELGGRIVIASTPGKGSRFILTLPLTLAVLDGMVVAVGDQTFVLPLSHIVESLQPSASDIHPQGRRGQLLDVRNAYVPLIKTSELLGVKGALEDPAKGVVILIESEGAGRFALAVDAILGQRQVVIKSFENNYQNIEGIAAATILGDGRVALILDVDGLAARCRAQVADAEPVQLRATGT